MTAAAKRPAWPVNTAAANAWTELRGISLDTWTWTGSPTCPLSYGIYMDATIDKGTMRYAIYSLSTSPSLFSGAVSVPADPYGPTWENSDEVPPKGDLFDILETLLP